MDYTDSSRVKLEMGSTKTTDDTLIGYLVTEASRAIDRYCTGKVGPASDDYFKSETKTAETLSLQNVDADGAIICYPHKPTIDSVTAFAYRYSPLDGWTDVSTSYVEIVGGHIKAHVGAFTRSPVAVKLTYIGGLASAMASLPADLVGAATVLAIRYYNDAKAGLGDVIGVSELGQVFYSKAIPQRVQQMLAPYRRTERWG